MAHTCRGRWVVGLALLLSLSACGGSAPASPDAAPGPRLAVVIVVDQMRADYLDRFRPQLNGGLADLLAEGAVFTEARDDHALTATAVGHASLLSGRYPSSTGILHNKWPDRRQLRVEGATYDPAERQLGGGRGSSPRRFIGTTLADWLRAAHREARVVAVAGKARVAVLMAGRATRDVYWYSRDSGQFTTSTYYRAELPGWVAQENARRGAPTFAGEVWNELLPDAEYGASDPDDSPAECDPYGMGRAFPHPLPRDPAQLNEAFELTPFDDQLTLAQAEAAVRSVGLGTDEVPDLLLIGLSATDAIGHAWGPRSREIEDQLLRLDRELGELFSRLEARVGRGRLLVALSADHGVTPIPGTPGSDGRVGRWVDLHPALAQLESTLEAELGRRKVVLALLSGVLYLDHAVIRAAGADPDRVAGRAAELFRAVPGVERAVTRAELTAPGEPRDRVERVLRNSFNPERGGDVYVVPEPGSVLLDPGLLEDGTVATSHGSPWDDDCRVPLILAGAGVPAGVHVRPVATVDLAPTFAALLGIEPTEAVDGTLLTEALPSP